MNIAIVDYPNVLKSSVFGLREMFVLANKLCAEHSLSVSFNVDTLSLSELAESQTIYTAIFLLPSVEGDFYLTPSAQLTDWLVAKHAEGSLLCSACAGAFILAATGLLNAKKITTHWNLENTFNAQYPDVTVYTDKIIVNSGDVITAGGMMSWVDLGLEVIAQLSSAAVMRQLGKILVIDTGQREQSYYQQFLPTYAHGDDLVLRAQKMIQAKYNAPIKIAELAALCHVTERTFLRRFVKATRTKPSEYIRRLRIQKACDLLENTQKTFEVIATEVGYEDVSACRKAFVSIIGLTPKEFRQRFVKN